MKKIKVAFICVHNSCRSQMAESMSKIFASDTYDAYSAGTHTKAAINSDAVDTIKKIYDIDMTISQKPKLIEEIPTVDVVVTMGCNVDCPWVPCSHREDWGLDDPTGKGSGAFIDTANIIKEKILDLKRRIGNDEITELKNGG